MRSFTAQRDVHTADEIWLVEHPPVFTLGQAGLSEHILAAGDIPVLRTERGGQVTYHGPGQVLAYILVDLKRAQMLIRDFVCRLETAVIQTLATLQIPAQRKTGAPGVYLSEHRNGVLQAGAKISALGIKVSRGCTFHGLALNVAMNLEPFSRINPCGYAGLQVIDIDTVLHQRGRKGLHFRSNRDLIEAVARRLSEELVKTLPSTTRSLASLPDSTQPSDAHNLTHRAEAFKITP